MFVPIHYGATAIGLLSIQSYTPQAYTAEDIDTLQSLADHCSGALERIRVGRAFIAIRDHDIAAEVIGVDQARYKVLAFAVSSAFVGLAGALTAYWTQILTWERFTLDTSIRFLAMIIVGGLGSVAGSIYGAAFMIALPAYLDQLSLRVSSDSFLAQDLPAIKLLVFGLTIVLFLVFEPKGLARIWERMKDYFRLWPFRY